MNIWVGIDPGLTGAVAFLNSDGEITFQDTPTVLVKKNSTRRRYNVAGMAAILRDVQLGNAHVAIEQVHAMPKQGVSSTFSLGTGYGMWLGIVSAFNIPYTLVEPTAWKKHQMSGMGKEKEASILRACQLFPEIAEDLKLKKHHNRADALLLADYIRQVRK